MQRQCRRQYRDPRITVENRGNYRLNGSLPVVNLIDLTLENRSGSRC